MARRGRAAEGEAEEGAGDEFSPEPDAGDLEFLSGADSDWRWRCHRMRTADDLAKSPYAQPRIFVATLFGAVDLSAFHAQHGGGLYEFWGTHDGQLKRKIVVELEGPPRILAPPAPPKAEPNGVAVTAPARDPELVAFLDRMDRRMEALERASQKSDGGNIVQLVTALGEMDNIRRRNSEPAAGVDPMAIVEKMLGIYRDGVAEGRGREPLPAEEGDATLKMLELAGKILEPMFRRPTVVTGSPAAPASPGIGTPIPPQPPNPAGPVAPREVSTATVLDEEEELSAIRMQAAIDRLARNLAQNVSAEITADDMETILTDREIDPLLTPPAGVPLEAFHRAVAGNVAERAGKRHQILTEDRGKDYVVQVLAALARD